MDSEHRTHDARARSEEALVRFALLADGHRDDFVVIGGLNPDFLVRNAPAPHLGTTDVDLLLELGFVYERDEMDFSWLDRVIARGGFTETSGHSGWRWDATFGNSLVRLDLLCDVEDSPGQVVALPGATDAAANNLRGPAAALRNPLTRELRVSDAVRRDFPDAPESVRLTFASLEGYLVAKASAFLARKLAKDAYDLMYVVMFAPGGARAAGEAVVRTEADGEHGVATLREALAAFTDPNSRWVDVVVDQMRTAGDQAEELQLRTDVTIAAEICLRAVGGSPPATSGGMLGLPRLRP